MLNRLLKNKSHWKHFYLLLGILCGCFSAFAQETLTVTGTITDASSDEGMPGVNILIKGTSLGTISDIQGKYSIQVKSEDVLIYTYVGFESTEVEVQNKTIIDVSLMPDIQSLGEVVVVAYGTQKKETVTGSIASISTREIKQSPAANLAASLAGRLPGLTSIQATGEPGKDAVSLYLRGQSTINGQSPVILVDGVPRDMSYIDPNEVESVTILKDASATAMFGVRGANGVILVTTRRGKRVKPEIGLTVETGLQQFTRTPDGLDSYQWATLKNQMRSNDGMEPMYSEDALNHFRLQDDPVNYPNNDWQDMLMHKYVAQTRYNLNLSGGSEYVSYFINAGFLNQGGQWKVSQEDYDPSSYLKRYNFRSNIDAYLNRAKTLKTFLNLAGYVENVNSPAGGAGLGYGNAINVLVDIYNTPPITPGPLTEDGRVLVYGNNNSPWATINRTGYVKQTRNNIMSSFGMEQDLQAIIPGLSAKFMISFDTRSIHNLNVTQDYARWNQVIIPASDGTDSIAYATASDNVNSTLDPGVSDSFETYSNFQFNINYNRVFGKHAIGALMLAQQDRTIKPQGGDNPSETDFPLPFNLRGLATRVTYGYNDKYFAEFNMGYNGSEQFAPGNRYGFFPAISAGWLISGENFLKGNKVVSLLKIRGSYGEVGNDKMNNQRFLYLDRTVVGADGYVGSGGTLGRLGQVINEEFVGNPYLTWETSKKTNIGLELGLFDQLNLIVDVFKTKNNTMLINRGTVPQLNGLPGGIIAPVNLGRLSSQGYEIELNYRKSINSKLSVLAKLNFNYATNEVEYVDEPKRTEDYAYQYYSTGFPIGTPFGLQSDGYWNSQEEIDNSGLTFIGRAPRPGDIKFIDLNEDQIIDNRDSGPIGYSTVPEYTFGGTFGINYGNFDVSILFQGISHVSRDYRTWGVWENYGNGFFTERHLNAWTPERYEQGLPIEYPALSTTATNGQNIGLPSDYWVENTSYIRLKNAEIGYTLPIKWSEKIGSERIRLYANGFNLFTWDKMKNKGYDPELEGPLTYPIYRTFNFGFNIIF